MTQRRIRLPDIPIGEPLRWDVSDANGRLLLKKGYVVEHRHQVEELVKRGLFANVQADVSREQHRAPEQQETPSVLRLIDHANKRLDQLLVDLHNDLDFPGKILETAELLAHAASLKPDIAIACVLLNQQVGPYPVRHSVDTAVISILVARSMQIAPSEITALTAAALTMNVGMIRHHARLERNRYSLSGPIVNLIRQHPQDGVKMLEAAGVREPNWLNYVLHHHENEDGSGYPFGKTGKDIPLPAKIISLADRYCACVSARDFRKSTLPNVALRDIFLEGGKGIDPILAAHFIKELGIYPPGTFVRLSNGEIAVVSHKGEAAATPVVHALIGPQGAPLALPIKRETAHASFAIVEALLPDQANIHVNMHEVWGDEAKL